MRCAVDSGMVVVLIIVTALVSLSGVSDTIHSTTKAD